ncbi:MAG: MFS transporter [Ktedonobacterales bacterium]|nr:MFS transporter [Ktedonobacterales bacterium]
MFWLMFSINAVNYLDRFIVVAVGPALKDQFSLTDRAIGLLSTAFILVYTVTALPLGLLADRASRARVVAVAVGVWSVMSATTALARGFTGLLLTRAAVGVGEAGYYPAGTALLSSYFPRRDRARVMSRWQTGQLVGVALAFVISAALFAWFGHGAWRLAFLITGVPGLVLAALMWRVPDAPPSDRAERLTEGEPPIAHAEAISGERLGGLLDSIRAVSRIRTVRLVILLQALVYAIATPAVTFLPIYMVSAHSPFHVSRPLASLIAGTVTVGGGLCGMLLGGVVADRLSVRHPGGRVLTAALGFGLALPFYIIMLRASSLAVFIFAGVLATLALNLQAGPLTAAVQDATPPVLRATAVAVILLFGHLLGDVWAPVVVGTISTRLHEHTGTALLIVGVPVLAVATIAATLGARAYVQDITHAPSASGT